MHRQFKTICHKVPDYNESLELVKDKVYYVFVDNNAYGRPSCYYYLDRPFTQSEIDSLDSKNSSIPILYPFCIYLTDESFSEFLYTKADMREININSIVG